MGQILCKSVKEIWSYRANKLCDGQTDGRTPSIYMSPPMASPWRGTIINKIIAFQDNVEFQDFYLSVVLLVLKNKNNALSFPWYFQKFQIP